MVAVGLHAVALATLLFYEPARSALFSVAPIMVDWIAPLRPEEPRREPPAELPKPKPVKQKPLEPLPVLTTTAQAPSPIIAPEVPSPPEPVAAAPEPAAVTPPIFNADYLDNPAPPYPALSRRLGEQGQVILRVLVNANGGADEVQVRTTSGHARLDDTARDTVKRWKFVPAKRGPFTVPAWVLIPISFKLEG